MVCNVDDTVIIVETEADLLMQLDKFYKVRQHLNMKNEKRSTRYNKVEKSKGNTEC